MQFQAKDFRRGSRDGGAGGIRSVRRLERGGGKGGSAQEQEKEQEGKESFHGGPPLKTGRTLQAAAHQNLK